MRRLLAWERQAIVDAMADGEKREAISAEFGVSKHYPTMLARRHGLPARGAGRPKRSQTAEPVLCVAVVGH